MSYRDFGTVSRSHVHDLEIGRKQPSPEVAAALDRALGADGQLTQLVRPVVDGAAAPEIAGDTDELDAFELARRVAASDVGAETISRLEWAVDQLATSYSVTPPAQLLARTRRYLSYSGKLLEPGVRKTLAEHRQLLTLGAWLSLIAATLHIDLRQDAAAAARLGTAESLARHAGNAEIEASALETRAWQAVTEGTIPGGGLSRARSLAPKGSSVAIQASAQEGRAWARLGRARETYAAIDRVHQLVSPLPVPSVRNTTTGTTPASRWPTRRQRLPGWVIRPPSTTPGR